MPDTEKLSDAQIQALLDAKDFAPAVAALRAQMVESKSTSAWQESALGSAQYFLKEYGAAVVHLQNAVLMDRFNKPYRNNLIMAQNSVDAGLGQSMSHPADWGFELSTWIRPKESASLAFLFLNGFLLLRFFKKPQFRRDIGLGLAVLLFLVVSGVGFYGDSLGVVVSNANLKQTPIESASDIRSLPAGSRVRKIRTSGEYTEIERSDAFRGWIKTSELRTFY